MLITVVISHLITCSVLVGGSPLMTSGDSRPMREDRRQFAQTEEGVRYAAGYLQEFGYLASNMDLDSKTNIQLWQMINQPLKQFQEVHHLEITGTLDDATIEEILFSRCGNPDNDEDITPIFADVTGGNGRNFVSQVKSITNQITNQVIGYFDDKLKKLWNKDAITYSVGTMPAKYDRQKVIAIIQKVIKRWETLSGIEITPAANSQRGTLQFTFEVIDVPWSTLGRAYFPPTGLIVFDTKENWDFLKPNGKGPNFEAVVQHEMGHAMGIPHTNNPKSIMYPRLTAGNQMFSRKDITKFRQLFGQPTLAANLVSQLMSDVEISPPQQTQTTNQQKQQQIQTTNQQKQQQTQITNQQKQQQSQTTNQQKQQQTQTTNQQKRQQTQTTNRQRQQQRNANTPNVATQPEQNTPKTNVNNPTSRQRNNQNRRLSNNRNQVNNQQTILYVQPQTQYYLQTQLGLVPINLATFQNLGGTIDGEQNVVNVPSSTAILTTDVARSVTSFGFASTTSSDISTTATTPPAQPADAPLALPSITPLDAVIPANTYLSVTNLVNTELIQMSQTRDWNGQLSWYPAPFGMSNRFLIMGRRRSLELVDTKHGQPMLAAEATIWNRRTQLKEQASKIFKDGMPSKILSSGNSVYVVDETKHCIYSILNSDISVFAGSCGVPGYLDGRKLGARFSSPVDMCAIQGNHFILDGGNSMIRRIDAYSGSVTTYANLPKNIIFEAMHCSGVNNIYLSGNDETTSYIYRVSSSFLSSIPTIRTVASLARGNGASGSLRTREATAYGLVTSLVVVNDQTVILNDGGLLRELNMNTGYIYTLCDRAQSTFGGIAGDCSIFNLDTVQQIGGQVVAMDVRRVKLLWLQLR